MTPTVTIQYKAATLADLKAALDLVTTYGGAKVIVSPPDAAPVNAPPAPKAESAPIVTEKEIGPMERKLLSITKREWMRLPADWTLSREAYAEHRLSLMDAPPAPKAESVPSPEELPADDGKKFDWED